MDILPTVLENERPAGPAPPAIDGPARSRRVLAGKAPETPAVSEISHRGIVAHGVRTEGDKYIRRFSPERGRAVLRPREGPEGADEPARRAAASACASEAAGRGGDDARTRSATSSASPAAGEYALALASGGWIERVEATGFGPGERYTVGENGRRLDPRRAAPARQAPRDRRSPCVRGERRSCSRARATAGRCARPTWPWPNRPRTPPAFPFRLPDIESEAEHEQALNLFASPKGDPPGLQLWLTLPPGRKLMELDKETRERLKALGYLGAN